MKAFFKAVKTGDTDKVALFLTRDPSLANAKDKNNFSPLMWAVNKGHTDIAKLLLDAGANPHAVHAETGSSLVHFAAEGGNLAIVDLLRKYRVDLNHSNLVTRASALHHAVMAGQFNILSTLIDKDNLNINAKTIDGDTPAHIAVTTNNLPALALLLKKGADTTIRNQDTEIGYTILESAMHCWQLELISCICGHLRMSPTDYVHARLLANVFNHAEICRLLEQDGNDYTQGGYYREALAQIIDLLTAYLDYVKEEKLFDTTALEKIIGHLRKYNQDLCNAIGDETPYKSNPTEPDYFVAGFKSHVIYGSVYPERNEYVISLYERGYFNHHCGDRVLPVRRINASNSELVEKAVTYLSQTVNETALSAKIILMETVPTLLGVDYTFDARIKQKSFIHGHCYFENLKSLLLDELIRFYGLRQGKMIYKQFDLFMHCHVLNNFNWEAEHVSKQAIVNLAKGVVLTKNQKIRAVNDQYILIDEETLENKKESKEVEKNEKSAGV